MIEACKHTRTTAQRKSSRSIPGPQIADAKPTRGVVLGPCEARATLVRTCVVRLAWSENYWLFAVNSARSASAVSARMASMSVKGVGWVAATKVALRSKRMFWMAEDGMGSTCVRGGGPDAYPSRPTNLTVWNSHVGILVWRRPNGSPRSHCEVYQYGGLSGG